MTIISRNYRLLQDFDAVSRFLTAEYKKSGWGQCMLQPRFEYAHTHPAFNYNRAHRFKLWQDDDEIVALICFEGDLGEALISAAHGYEFLYDEMLTYAEKELAKVENGQHSLEVSANDTQTALRRVLETRGYTPRWSHPILHYDYAKGFLQRELPKGFTLHTLQEEDDFRKIHTCLWKGFDHSDEPDDDWDCRRQMQSGPHFRQDLTFVIVAPDGEYACFAGMWLDQDNDYAYLEPLATVPEHRRKGLATVILMEAMKRTQAFGATYCIGGSREFYEAIGFERRGTDSGWYKTW